MQHGIRKGFMKGDTNKHHGIRFAKIKLANKMFDMANHRRNMRDIIIQDKMNFMTNKSILNYLNTFSLRKVESTSFKVE